MTADGTIAGTVDDLLFDEVTGNVNSFEVSDESATNVSKRTLPLPLYEESPIQLYDEVEQGVIVHTSEVRQPAVEQRIAAKAVQSAEDAPPVEASFNQETDLGSAHARRFIESCLEEASQTRVTFTEYLSQVAKHAVSFLNQKWTSVRWWFTRLYKKQSLAIVKYRAKNALGYRVNRAIFDSRNEMIIDRGHVITRVVIERAKRAGVLVDLLRSVERTSTKSTAPNHEQRSGEGTDEFYPPFI